MNKTELNIPKVPTIRILSQVVEFQLHFYFLTLKTIACASKSVRNILVLVELRNHPQQYISVDEPMLWIFYTVKLNSMYYDHFNQSSIIPSNSQSDSLLYLLPPETQIYSKSSLCFMYSTRSFLTRFPDCFPRTIHSSPSCRFNCCFFVSR